MTDPMAAPMIVPATPRNDAARADVTAASALAAICAAPSPSRGAGVSWSEVWAVVVDVMKAWGLQGRMLWRSARWHRPGGTGSPLPRLCGAAPCPASEVDRAPTERGPAGL